MRTKSAQLVPNWKYALIISFEKLHIACEGRIAKTCDILKPVYLTKEGTCSLKGHFLKTVEKLAQEPK